MPNKSRLGAEAPAGVEVVARKRMRELDKKLKAPAEAMLLSLAPRRTTFGPETSSRMPEPIARPWSHLTRPRLFLTQDLSNTRRGQLPPRMPITARRGRRKTDRALAEDNQ